MRDIYRDGGGVYECETDKRGAKCVCVCVCLCEREKERERRHVTKLRKCTERQGVCVVRERDT